MRNKKSWVLQKVKITVNIDGISHNPFSLNIFDYPYLKSSQDTEDQNLVLVTLI